VIEIRKGAVVALTLTSLAAGAVGAWIFAPGTGGAATSTTTTPNAGNGSSGQFHSNEDPTHESSESPQREAAENSGQLRHGNHRFGSNEDPTHESGESQQREAQENAGQHGSNATPVPSTNGE
jgi:hypothetical protein